MRCTELRTIVLICQTFVPKKHVSKKKNNDKVSLCDQIITLLNEITVDYNASTKGNRKSSMLLSNQDGNVLRNKHKSTQISLKNVFIPESLVIYGREHNKSSIKIKLKITSFSFISN